MAKKSGLSQQFYIHGFDLSGDVGSLENAAAPRATLDVTAINKSAHERVNGHADGLIDFRTWFNDTAGQEHLALRGLPTGDRIVIYAMGGAIGDVAAGLVAKQVNYDWARGLDGSLQGSIQALGQGTPIEWGEMLTAGVDVFASASSAASKDDAAGTSNGLAAYLAVVDIDSGTPTVVIEDSPDNSVWATLVSFTAVADGAEPTGERVTVAGTVDRYLRITTTGTFTNLDCAVMYRRGTAQDSTAY